MLGGQVWLSVPLHLHRVQELQLQLLHRVNSCLPKIPPLLLQVFKPALVLQGGSAACGMLNAQHPVTMTCTALYSKLKSTALSCAVLCCAAYRQGSQEGNQGHGKGEGKRVKVHVRPQP